MEGNNEGRAMSLHNILKYNILNRVIYYYYYILIKYDLYYM